MNKYKIDIRLVETIETALERQITRGNCNTCSRLFIDKDGKRYCDVTEELIGSGDEYCELE